MPSGGGADASLSSLASLMGGDDADATARLKQAIAAMQGEGGASMGDLMKGMADGENSMAKMMQARRHVSASVGSDLGPAPFQLPVR